MKVDTSGTAASCKLQRWLHVTARLQMGSLRCRTSPHLVIHQTAPHHTAEYILSSSIPQITQYDCSTQTRSSSASSPPRGKSPSTPSCHTPGRMKRSSSKMHATAATVCFPVGSRASTNWSRAPPRRARTAISTSGTTPAASTSRAAPNCTARSPKIDLRHRFKVPGAPDASSTNTSDKDKHSSAIVYGASIYYYRGGLAGFVLVWGRADTASSNTASSGGSQKSEDEPPWMLEIYVPLGT